MSLDTQLAPVADYGFLPDDVRAFIARTESFDPPPGSHVDVAELRRRYDAMCREFEVPHPAGVVATDLPVAGIACRRYRPADARDGLTAIYFHGGGFVLGGLHSHDSICAELAQRTGLELIAVDYRLAPEHPHPAAHEDACTVTAALPGPKLLIGDSAGGTLAASVAARMPGADIHGQVLIYPGLGGDPALPSMRRHAEAPLLRAADIASYQAQRGGPAGAEDATARPLLARDFDGLPPSAIFAAANDPLASDAAIYAQRLSRAGVPVSLTLEPDLVHGYLRARHVTAAGRAAFDRIVAAVLKLAG